MARFGLKEKAERLGAEVALLQSPRMVEVAALAGRRWPMALTCSAWLMGWDPGAQVADTAAGQGQTENRLHTIKAILVATLG